VPRPATSPDPDSDATFLGWQDSLSGDIFPLYTVTVGDHPLCHSTVSDVTLRKMHLRIPRTLSPYPDAGPAPWHDLGTELHHPKTAREAIESAIAEYTFSKTQPPEGAGVTHDAPATGRTKDGTIPDNVRTRFESLRNRDDFAFFDALVEKQEAVYETAGVLGLGDRIWILAKLSGYIKVHHNDIVDKYLLLTSSHNGTSHVRVKLTPIRAVCNNTLTSTFRGAGDVHVGPAHHTARDSDQGDEVLALSHSLYRQLDVIFNGMAATKISAEQLQGYVQALVPDSEETENDATAETMRNSVLRLHDSGKGANLSRGTLWGAFNSVTEYADHMMLRGDPTDRLNSIWFGRGEQLKLKAFHLAEQMLRA
jgi:phage/plasmid-like protein (TIGR03299 family)